MGTSLKNPKGLAIISFSTDTHTKGNDIENYNGLLLGPRLAI